MLVRGDENEILTRSLNIPYQPVRLPSCDKLKVEVLMRRDDLIDKCAVGNKFYKLFFNLLQARREGKTRLVTMGGPWSNHLLACALVAHQNGLQSKGLVRGRHHRYLSDTLQQCRQLGMELTFLTNEQYRSLSRQQVSDDRLSESLPVCLQPQDYFIPEGGSNWHGVAGCEYLGRAIAAQQPSATSVCLAVGTGGTFCGVVRGLEHQCLTVGIPVLKNTKGGSALFGLAQIRHYPWRLVWGFDSGGYGRAIPPALLGFWRRFEQDNQILVDPVYTLKMLWGVDRLAAMGYWSSGDRIIVIHTGGLQGRCGFRDQIDWQLPVTTPSKAAYG